MRIQQAKLRGGRVGLSEAQDDGCGCGRARPERMQAGRGLAARNDGCRRATEPEGGGAGGVRAVVGGGQALGRRLSITTKTKRAAGRRYIAKLAGRVPSEVRADDAQTAVQGEAGVVRVVLRRWRRGRAEE